MNFEDCMSNIKNLEGIIDFDHCLKKTSTFDLYRYFMP